MKVALITDTHFGARDGRSVFHDFFAKFYTETFFPFLQQNNIYTILHLGDCFDRRKYIDFYSLKRSKEYFFEPLRRQGIRMHVLVGNHDSTYRNTLEVNSPDLILEEYDNIDVINHPRILDVGGTSILMVPWICADTHEDSMSLIKGSAADICFGHFEIQGFAMYRGMESLEGLPKELFDRYDLVCSGHYHSRSSKGNITYLGNPYEITHMDYNDQRGFHVFDTDTRELTFVPNPFTLFTKYVYDDQERDPLQVDASAFKDKFLKIVVQKKTDFYKFDLFMDRVYNCGSHEVKIVEDLNDDVGEIDTSTIDIEDTMSILSTYVDKLETVVDKDRLSTYIKTLYTESLNVEG